MIKFRWVTLVNRQEKEREVDPEIFDRTVCPLSLSLTHKLPALRREHSGRAIMC